MTEREALKIALEALKRATNYDPVIARAIAAIKEALAQPEQEPVACGYDETTGNCTNNPCCYTTPPQRPSRSDIKPLTDEELRVIENKINPNMRWRSSDEEGITLYPIEYYELVRAIEAAHGIKGEA